MKTHSNEYAVKVNGFVEELERFNKGFNATFECVAVEFPEFNTVLKQICNSLGNLFDDTTHQSVLNVSRHIENLNTQRNICLDSIADDADKNASRFNALEARIVAVAEYVSKIRAQSEDLSLFALNTRLMTKETRGSAAATFKSITSELTQAAKSIELQNKALIAALDTTRADMGEKQAKQQGLEEKIIEKALDVEVAITDATSRFDTALDQLKMTMTESFKTQEQLEPVIRDLMLKIQRQDIVRQALEHLSFVWTQIGQRTYPLDSKAHSSDQMTGETQNVVQNLNFLTEGTRLSNHLYVDCRSSAIEFLDNMTGALEKVSGCCGEFSKFQDIMGDAAEFKACIRAPIAAFSDLLQSMDDIATELERTATARSEMLSSMQALRRVLTSFSSVLKDLNVLEIVLRIEGTCDASISRDVVILSNEFREIHHGILISIREIRKEILEIRDGIHTYLTGDQKRFHSLLSAFKAEWEDTRNNIEDALSLFVQVYAKAATLYQRIHSSSVHLVNDAGMLRSQLPDIDSIQSLFREIREQAEYRKNEIIATCDDTVNPYARSTELDEIVGRFSVFSQKLAARDVLDVSIEQGDDEGELTLF